MDFQAPQDFLVPLNRLIFGQEDGAGINARVTGRDDGIAELAANIYARGLIENLVVKRVGGIADELYSVSNGNRRLAALRMIHGDTSAEAIRCTLRDVDEDGAFEDSLTTAVTAKQLHPVDQYEAFARLRDKAGKTVEEIARQYGMSEREVEQALALGHLSPKVREAWRKGEMKAAAAKAFTLAADHKAQDEALETLRGENNRFGRDGSDFDDYDVKEILKIDENAGMLVEFVGIDAYVARGGKVTRDLFGVDHHVSDAKLAGKMADEKLASECERLKKAGWSFAATKNSVRNTHWNYSSLKVEPKPTPEEKAHLAELEQIFNGGDLELEFWELSATAQNAFLEHRALEQAIELRAYTPKMMAKAGCFVEIDDKGMLKVEYGKVKPAQKEAAAAVAKTEKEPAKKKNTAATEGAPPPESKVLSKTLIARLESQLIAATRDAIAAEPLLINSPLFELLAKVVCSQIDPGGSWRMPDSIRTKLPSIRQALNAGVFNAAIAKRFEAEDYFSSAPKGFVIKAIAEAINPDEARKASTGKTKAEIWKFAFVNLGRTGWLPKELRTVHYAGPGSERGLQTGPGRGGGKRSEPLPDEKTTVLPPKASPKPPAKASPVKRAAASKKAAKKTSKR